MYFLQHRSSNLHSEDVQSSAGLKLAMLCNWSDLQNHSEDILKNHIWAFTTIQNLHLVKPPTQISIYASRIGVCFKEFRVSSLPWSGVDRYSNS